MTLGEYRVGITFNPGNNPKVDALKRAAADFIDACEEMRAQEGRPAITGEVARLISLAQTHMEDAAMWAVKAATKPAMT